MSDWVKVTNDEFEVGIEIATLKKGELQIKYAKDIVAKDKEIERLNNIINQLEELELYTAEEDYDYEENPIDKYIPFEIEDYIKELKGDSSND